MNKPRAMILNLSRENADALMEAQFRLGRVQIREVRRLYSHLVHRFAVVLF